MHILPLPVFGAFESWRKDARKLSAAQVSPSQVRWQRHGDGPSLFESSRDVHAAAPTKIVVPKAFISLAEQIVCSAESTHLSMLYDLLLRLQREPQLLENPADALVRKLQRIEKSIRRDIHKMHAFVRFKELENASAERWQFAAWFEPENFTVERAAHFFARRFADMDWVIATPKGAAHFVDGELSFGFAGPRTAPVHDKMDEMWRAYYANIFNPARLKVKAMQAQMPKKYWKNLPEAPLIPELIATAEARAAEMRQKMPSAAPANLEKFKAKAITQLPAANSYNSLEELRQAAKHCQRCPLHSAATQTVCGEGSQAARIMFVGEQPGDQEDLSGRPFVGPAGEIFNEALAKAGMSREHVYITNAVKHFKFTPRGKRRIHQRPNASEIQACSWWLQHEIELVKPRLIVAMGATALYALAGSGSSIIQRRGKFEQLKEETQLLITYHPSAILRAPTQEASLRMRTEFESDLSLLRNMW